MKYIAVILFFFSFTAYSFAEEIPLTEDEKLIQNLEEQVANGLPTIKRFLAERGVCNDIYSSNTIFTWKNAIIDNVSKPIEVRTNTYNTQKGDLTDAIDRFAQNIDTIEQTIEQKKDEFLNSIGIITDYDSFVAEIKRLQAQVLDIRAQLNKKKQELENITTTYTQYSNLSREEITSIVETAINNHCGEWYGKVELSDRKSLDTKATSLEGSGIGTVKKVSKYKKILDQVSVMYIKNPQSVEKLGERLNKVLPKISKSHKYYEVLVDLKKHIEGLLKESN